MLYFSLTEITVIFTTDSWHFLSRKDSVVDLKTLDVKAHLQECPSPAGCFPGYAKATGGCLNWIAGDSWRDSIVGQKKKCVWCLSGSWASQRIWHVTSVSHRGKLQQEVFQSLSTYISSHAKSRKNTSNVDFENEIWSAHSQFLHFLFCWQRRESIFVILRLFCACYKYRFAWSSALPRLFDDTLKEQKLT